MAIRDKTTFGTLIGLISTIPQLIINLISVQLKISKYYDFQLSGSIYLDKNLTYTLSGLILGGIVWESMAAFLGIVTVYYIYWTGKDSWWLKGLIVSNAIMYVFIYGLYFSLGAPKIIPWDLNTNWSVLIENAIFGLTAGYLIKRWGETAKPK